MHLLGLIIVRVDGERFDKWGSEMVGKCYFRIFFGWIEQEKRYLNLIHDGPRVSVSIAWDISGTRESIPGVRQT